jgi:MFS transporter, CP family, cyanate transporter
MPALAKTPVPRLPWAAWGVFALGLVSALHVGKLPVAIPLLGEELGIGLVQAGVLLSLLQLAGMLSGVAVGGLADARGPHWVMRWGLLLLGLGSMAGALAQSAGGLLAARALESIGFLWAVLPAPACMRLHVHDPVALQRSLGLWGAYMPAGSALALMLGAAVMPWLGWRTFWWMGALLTMGAALALWWVSRSIKPMAPSLRESLWQRLQATLRAPGPWALALGFLVYSGQWLAVVGFVPALYTQLGWSVMAGGMLAAAVAGANVVGNVLAGRWLAQGMRRHTVLSWGYLAMAVGGCLAFGDGVPLPMRLAGVFLFSALGGLVPGALFASAVHLSPGPERVSTTVGWMQQLSSLGQLMGPPLVAWWAVQVGGWQLSWVFTLACSLAGLALAQWIRRLCA